MFELPQQGGVSCKPLKHENGCVKTLAFVQKDTPNKFLCDIVGADIMLSILELFKIPASWDEIGFQRVNKMALIMSEVSMRKRDLAFFEDTSVNRGWNVKLFNDKASAVDWLIN